MNFQREFQVTRHFLNELMLYQALRECLKFAVIRCSSLMWTAAPLGSLREHVRCIVFHKHLQDVCIITLTDILLTSVK